MGVGRFEGVVRPLTYAWEQTDEELKIYISFDQSEELSAGISEDCVDVEFGEWNLSLVLRTGAATPLGLRLGDFQKRIDPDRCRMTIRSSRITLRLRKQEKEHWFCLLQKKGAH